jgi:hypothetical protein
MTVDPIVPAEFIETYKRFSHDLYLPNPEVRKAESNVERLHRARKRFFADSRFSTTPQLLERDGR